MAKMAIFDHFGQFWGSKSAGPPKSIRMRSRNTRGVSPEKISHHYGTGRDILGDPWAHTGPQDMFSYKEAHFSLKNRPFKVIFGSFWAILGHIWSFLAEFGPNSVEYHLIQPFFDQKSLKKALFGLFLVKNCPIVSYNTQIRPKTAKNDQI